MRLIDADALLEQIDTERDILAMDGRLGTEHILVHYVREFIEDAPTIDPTELGFVKADAILEDVNKRQYWIDRYQAPRFYITAAVWRAVRRLIERQTGERYHEEIKDE